MPQLPLLDSIKERFAAVATLIHKRNRAREPANRKSPSLVWAYSVPFFPFPVYREKKEFATLITSTV